MGWTTRIGAVLAVTALAGCSLGQSRLNPFNWFGSEREEQIAQARGDVARPLVAQVVSLDVAPTPSGAIVSSVGLPPTQGFWEADLIRMPSDDPSVLVLDFQILPPLSPEPVGTQPSREVLAGQSFTTQELAGIRTIVVQGLQNRRSVSRR
ncbi:hypothetical protein [Jannaschia pohangensis]|uniref:Lipoprotein n=1 Tax=Jannaschia pohangensis TaxID=390807 RepID=A0A1I3GTK2_9RHOB|nr:hypothetical protein [Jannaschia pohangensis]SFI26671.1 hypothetical protein SAMN04488095_0322 [Jannaschia pohangensis]